MSNKSMQFLFGDRELLLTVQDLLMANTSVIVNSSNSKLTFPGGLGSTIREKAGQLIQAECEQIVQEYGSIDSGMAVYTSAGKLPYAAVIHAVGPVMGEGDEQFRLEQAISRSLQLCEMNEWKSVAFPMIGAGHGGLPIEICARGFFRAITHFWDARHECVLEKIMITSTLENLQPFFDSFREESLDEPEEVMPADDEKQPSAGEVTLSDEDISSLDDEDFNDWFK